MLAHCLFVPSQSRPCLAIGGTYSKRFLKRLPDERLENVKIDMMLQAEFFRNGEHVIGEEVEKAMKLTMEKFADVELVEFTVAPQVAPSDGLPHHEWIIEFAREPKDVEAFSLELDKHLRKLNVYYDDLITGNILRTLRVNSVRRNTFIDYMKSVGKLGGQNKVPRLSNDRKIADALSSLA